MANENKLVNIGKKLPILALPIILQKGSEIAKEWADKIGSEESKENKKIK